MRAEDKILVTIVTEAVLETELSRLIENSNVSGYTILDVRGKGQSGKRHGDWQASASIKIEVICQSEAADLLVRAVEKDYFDNFHTIVYKSPVEVVRPEKFK